MATGFLRSYRMAVKSAVTDGDVLRGTIADNQVKAVFGYKSTASQSSGDNHLIKVYNPSYDTLVALREKGAMVEFYAGYRYEEGIETLPEDLPLIFRGEVVESTIVRTSTDTILSLELSQGYSQFKAAHISESFEAGEYLEGVLDVLINSTGMGSVVALGERENDTLLFDRTYSGASIDVLEEVCRTFGLRWYIFLDTVYVVTSDEPSACRPGEPTITQVHNRIKGDINWTVENDTDPNKPQIVQVDLTLFLFPTIALGNTLSLTLEDADITLTVVAITHTLDFYGESWETNIIANNQG